MWEAAIYKENESLYYYLPLIPSLPGPTHAPNSCPPPPLPPHTHTHEYETGSSWHHVQINQKAWWKRCVFRYVHILVSVSILIISLQQQEVQSAAVCQRLFCANLPTLQQSSHMSVWVSQFCPQSTWVSQFCPQSTWVSQFCPQSTWVSQFCPQSTWVSQVCPQSTWVSQFYPQSNGVSSWILMSCQLPLITSGLITHWTFPYTSSKLKSVDHKQKAVAQLLTHQSTGEVIKSKTANSKKHVSVSIYMYWSGVENEGSRLEAWMKSHKSEVAIT